MGTTPNFSFPYPELGDTPDGADQTAALASAVDTTLATQIADVVALVSAIVAPVGVRRPDTHTFPEGTALQLEPDIVVPLADAEGTYQFHGYVEYDAGANSGFKWSWAIPAGAVFRVCYDYTFPVYPNPVTLDVEDTTPIAGCTAGPGATQVVKFDGTVKLTGTSGELQFEFANVVTGSGAGYEGPTIYLGSYMVVQKILS